MIVELYAKTDAGKVRRGNEDNFLIVDVDRNLVWIGSRGMEPPIGLSRFEVQNNGVVLAVSDGLGGMLAGDIASQMVVDCVCEMLLEDYDGFHIVDSLKNAAGYANLAIYLRSQEDSRCAGMGATLTAAAVTRNIIDFVQIGDSRGYLIRKNQILRVTKDQSLVQQLVDVGQISEEEAETHMFRNVILQAVGAQSDLFPVTCYARLQRKDTLLLCSDGLSGKLRTDEILRVVIEHSNLARACDELIGLANERGGEDNITVILARFTGDDLEEPSEGIIIELPDLEDDGTLDDDYEPSTEPTD